MKRKIIQKDKDRFIFDISKSMKIPEETVEQVVNFVISDTLNAFRKNESIEISGFGTFYVSRSKLFKKYISYTLSKEKIENDPLAKQESLDRVNDALTKINQKIDEIGIREDIRGLEELYRARQRHEGGNPEDIPRET